jgi:hypothetical protein
MMAVEKRQPPPDSVGNLHGRMLAVRAVAAQLAAMDVKNGADPQRAEAKRLAEAETALKGLRRRLALVLKKPGPKEPEVAEDFLESLKSA